MSRDSKTGSIPEKKSGFTVDASPLNPVKLELGAILIIGVVLLLIVEYIADSRISQLGILGCYGLSAMGWLVIRTKKTLQAHQESPSQDQNSRG